jgi:hypothetical protein
MYYVDYEFEDKYITKMNECLQHEKGTPQASLDPTEAEEQLK